MENDTRVLGVIGGLGPLAASHFMELVSQFTDAATDLTNVKAAKAILFAGTDTAAWTAAIPSVKTSALMGLCAATPDAFAALQAQTVDFIAFNDPIDLMYKAVDAAHTLLSTEQALAEWSPTAATLVLTPGDPRLASYMK